VVERTGFGWLLRMKGERKLSLREGGSRNFERLSRKKVREEVSSSGGANKKVEDARRTCDL